MNAGNQEKLRAIIESALDCIITMDHKGRIIDFNPAAEQTFGYKRHEVAGKTVEETIVPPEFREAHRRGLAHFMKTQEGPVLGRRIEIPALRADGSTILVELAIKAIQTEENLPFFTAYIRDITQRKEREEALKRSIDRLELQYTLTRICSEGGAVAEAIPRMLRLICAHLGWQIGAFWIRDPESESLRCVDVYATEPALYQKFIHETRQMSLASGVGLPGTVLLKKEPLWISDVTHSGNFPRADAASMENLHSAFAFPVQVGGRVSGVLEFFGISLSRPEGDLLQMLNASGTQIGIFIERKKAEEEILKSQRDLERSNAQLEQFAYSSSHDLQEPLRTISTCLSAIQPNIEKQLDGEGRKFFDMAIKASVRAQLLIRDLLIYAKSGRQEIKPAKTDLNAILEEALGNLKSALDKEKVVVEAASLPVVSAIAPQMLQLFQNLLSNSLKYRGENPLRIAVSCADTGPDFEFTFKDTGMGIAPEHHHKIFVLFQRLNKDTDTGTGIGLALCKKIVEQHGGRIWVESDEGRGASFKFTLPK